MTTASTTLPEDHVTTTSPDEAAERVRALGARVCGLEREAREVLPAAMRAALRSGDGDGLAEAQGRADELTGELGRARVELTRAQIDAAHVRIAACEVQVEERLGLRRTRGQALEQARAELQRATEQLEAAEAAAHDAVNAWTGAGGALERATDELRRLEARLEAQIGDLAGTARTAA